MKNPVKMLADLAQRLAGARTALSEIHDVEADFRRRLDELANHRAKLIGDLPPREDLIREADRQVDELGRAWLAARGPELARACAGRIDLDSHNVPTGGVVPGSLLAALPGALDLPTLCGLMPATVKRAIADVLHGVEYEPGPAMSERARLVAAVDEEIASVQKEHSALCDEASSVGVAIELLPEEKAKRIQAEQRRREAERYNAANRDLIARGRIPAKVAE